MKVCIYCSYVSSTEFFKCPSCYKFNPILIAGRISTKKLTASQNSTAICPKCKNGLTVHSSAALITHYTCSVCKSFRMGNITRLFTKQTAYIPIRDCPNFCSGALFYEKTLNDYEVLLRCNNCNVTSTYNFANYTFNINTYYKDGGN